MVSFGSLPCASPQTKETEKMDKKTLYQELVRTDIIHDVLPLFQRGLIHLDIEGKIPGDNQAFDTATPWIIVIPSKDRKCAKWHNIYWERYRFQSWGCFNCWKVMVNVDTLSNLFKIYELQQRLGLEGKCGLEERAWTRGIYTAAWYCPLDGGLEEARKMWTRINKAVKEVTGLPTTLKRACTEMELALGPSDSWEYTEGNAAFEALLDSTYDDPPNELPHPAVLKTHVMKKWIQEAWKNNDPTVAKFISQPIVAPLITYNKSIHSEKDFPKGVSDRESGNREPECERCKESSCQCPSEEGIALLQDVEEGKGVSEPVSSDDS